MCEILILERAEVQRKLEEIRWRVQSISAALQEASLIDPLAGCGKTRLQELAQGAPTLTCSF